MQLVHELEQPLEQVLTHAPSKVMHFIGSAGRLAACACKAAAVNPASIAITSTACISVFMLIVSFSYRPYHVRSGGPVRRHICFNFPSFYVRNCPVPCRLNHPTCPQHHHLGHC